MTSECLGLRKKRDMYHINIDKELARESVGDTTPFSKFDNESLAMILIGNIITGIVCFQSTDLHVQPCLSPQSMIGLAWMHP